MSDGAPKQPAPERTKQILGAARPRHRDAEDLGPKDRASRECGLQCAGCAMGKGETPVKDGRRKARHESFGQDRHCPSIQLEARAAKH